MTGGPRPREARRGLRIACVLLSPMMLGYTLVLRNGERLSVADPPLHREGKVVVPGGGGTAREIAWTDIDEEATHDANLEGVVDAPFSRLRLRSQTPPVDRACKARVWVIAEAVLGVDGTIETAKLIRAPDDPCIVAAALRALHAWTFEPPVDEEGRPVRVRFTVSFPVNHFTE